MLPLAKTEDYDNYYRFMIIDIMDEIQIAKAGSVFENYRQRGVIQNKKFADSVWTLNSEVRRRNFCFQLDTDLYNNGAGEWIGISRTRFQTMAKVYVCLRLGELELGHLASVASQLGRLGYTTADNSSELKEQPHIIAFLKLLPGESMARDVVIEKLESDYQTMKWNKSAPRRLSDFKNYLSFDRALKEFWEYADEEKKVQYFPIYFWWVLTAILPLRATEFLLIPGECIRKEKERYVLKIRRTKLKKKGRITYRIDSDYELHEYEIPDGLAEEILRYKEQNLNHQQTTLLVPSEMSSSWYMTYGQLSARLKKFLNEEIIRPDLSVHIGDTRHLAMINLMLSGGSPTICKELAGHESIDISSNYYANLSTIIESSVYDYCNNQAPAAVFSGEMRFPVSGAKSGIVVEGGQCSYLPVKDGDISECMKNYTRGKTLGDCRSCIHFLPEQRGVQLKIIHERKNAVDKSSEYLIQMIDAVRHGNGAKEDISAALARLQNSSYKYAGILMHEYEGRKG